MPLVLLDLMDFPSPAVAGELDLSLDLTLTLLLEVIRTVMGGTPTIKAISMMMSMTMMTTILTMCMEIRRTILHQILKRTVPKMS